MCSRLGVEVLQVNITVYCQILKRLLALPGKTPAKQFRYTWNSSNSEAGGKFEIVKVCMGKRCLLQQF